jgi:predicted DNA-binding protein YlxM (UPF0122 family)
MKDDLHFLRLWDMYSPLLTATQQEIADLYFNYDLSLGEIAEQKGVSRQSVSDCLQKCRKQLEKYDEKLGFLKALDELSQEYSAYMTTVERFIDKEKQNFLPLVGLKETLDCVQKEFGVEQIALADGAIVGKTIREEE